MTSTRPCNDSARVPTDHGGEDRRKGASSFTPDFPERFVRGFSRDGLASQPFLPTPIVADGSAAVCNPPGCASRWRGATRPFMGRLADKVALVTGGGRGIGRGIVLAFAREGADVAIAYRRDREAAQATAREVDGLGRRAMAVQADVSDREAVDRLVGEVRAAFGRIDVGVANSGVASRVAAVHEMDPDEWRRVIATDLDGAFYTARAVLPALLETRGVLLFVSSIGADMAGAGGAPYHAAKAGVNTLMRVVAKEVAGAGVRVNCIAPGLVRSDMGDRLIRFVGEGITQAIPLGRVGEASDIGKAAVYLASDDASWVTGQVLRVDGGACM